MRIDAYAYRVEYNDKKSFADKAIKLLSDKNLRAQMGKNALKSPERYKLDKMILKWERTYASLIKR